MRASSPNSTWVSATCRPSTATSCRVRRQLDVAQSQDHRRLRADLSAPQQRVDACEQLARAERFHQVVVGADAKAADAIGLVRSRAQEEDRHDRSGAPDLRADLEAVLAGQHDVENQAARLGLTNDAERLTSGAADDHAMSRAFQVRTHDIAGGLVVFDHEDWGTERGWGGFVQNLIRLERTAVRVRRLDGHDSHSAKAGEKPDGAVPSGF